MPDFGIGELIAAFSAIDAGLAGAATGVAGSLGADAALATGIGGLAAGGIEGAALGAGFGALTGGDPGMGALLGGAGGGIAGGFGAAGGGGVADVTAGAAAGDALATPAAGSLGVAAAPAGPSAAGAGSIGDVTGAGAGGGFTLPGASASPDLSANIGSGASSGTFTGTGSFAGAPLSAGLAPVEQGPGGLALGGGPASSGLDGLIAPGGDAAALPGAAGPASGFQPNAVLPNLPAAQIGSPAAPGAAPTSIDRFIDKPGLDTGLKAAGANANILLPAGVLAAQALTQPSLPNPTTISRSQEGTAGNLTSQGRSLLDSLNTGNIPAGAQNALDQATNAAIARVRSQYAGMGLNGSTMETQAINQIQQQAEAQKFDIIKSLVNTGITETQLGDQIYESLLRDTLGQDRALSESISRFAAASAGGSRPLIVAGG
jgi:hypothetical protein